MQSVLLKKKKLVTLLITIKNIITPIISSNRKKKKLSPENLKTVKICSNDFTGKQGNSLFNITNFLIQKTL
jgi:hypothetical protein